MENGQCIFSKRLVRMGLDGICAEQNISRQFKVLDIQGSHKANAIPLQIEPVGEADGANEFIQLVSRVRGGGRRAMRRLPTSISCPEYPPSFIQTSEERRRKDFLILRRK